MQPAGGGYKYVQLFQFRFWINFSQGRVAGERLAILFSSGGFEYIYGQILNSSLQDKIIIRV